MTKIELREPPPRVATGRRPIMALDQDILTVAARAKRPVEIADFLRENGHPQLTTQRVASRLKSLVQRDLAERIKPPGAPANGPGTSLYRAKAAQPSDG